MRRALQLALLVLLAALPCFAQATFDQYGGKITNADGSTASVCSATPGNLNYQNAGASLSGNGTTATATITTGSFYNTIASSTYPNAPIFVLNASNPAFNVTAAPVLATVTSATTLTFPSSVSGTATGATILSGTKYIAEVNKHWWYCSALGHEFFPESPTNPLTTIHGSSNVAGVVERHQYFGFNSIGVEASTSLNPTSFNCPAWQATHAYASGAFVCDTAGYIQTVTVAGTSGSSAPAWNDAPSGTTPGDGGVTWSVGITPSKGAISFFGGGTSPFFAYYAVTEPSSICSGTIQQANPPKDIFKVHSSFYNAYGGYNGVADYFDSTISAYDTAWLACDPAWTGLGNSGLKLAYMNAVPSDDADNMSGIAGGGPDFATLPAGQNTQHLALDVATMSPLETATTNAMERTGANFVYAHTQNYTKLALRNALATEYGTIGALNTAWGTGGVYTTFDSSGTCVGSQPITCATSVAADSVGTGDGTTLTFSSTLSHHTGIAAFSCQILVAGSPVAGCVSQEGSASYSFYGPNVSSGSINPTTGAFTITFTTGHAPANAAAITATYVDCGWGCGTGFLDEDGRVSHQGWMGTDYEGMSNANATTKADLNTWYQALAAQYFSTTRSVIKTYFPWALYMGCNALGTWSAPPFAPVLKAAGQYLDTFISGGGGAVYTTAELAYVLSNYGNKPIIQGWYTSANADSAIDSTCTGGCNVSFDYATQPARATAYYNLINASLTSTAFSTGDMPYVGIYWWQYIDQSSQTYADGLVTPTDNAYNASDAASGAVTCVGVTTPPNTCGSEPAPGGTAGAVRPFGDLLDGATGVIAANHLWYATNYGSSSTPVVPAPTSILAQVAKK